MTTELTAPAAIPTLPRVLGWSWKSFFHATAMEWVLLAYAGLSQLIANATGTTIPWHQMISNSLEIKVALFGGPIVWLCSIFVLAFGNGYSLLEAGSLTFKHIVNAFRSPLRLLDAARMILGVKITVALYSGLKQKIPMLNPVLYDVELELIDRWLTLGWSPLDVLRTLMGGPTMMKVIDHLYVGWYLLKVPMFLAFAMHPCSRTRWHFFLTYNLTWIICGACAVIIPSVGPCYFTPEQFVDAEMPMGKIVQADLWVKYSEAVLNPTSYSELRYRGVAAFPSLHVGIAVFFALATRRWPAAHYLLVVYAFMIFIGSVLLGWHYACDGYFSAIVTALIYFGTAKWMGVSTKPIRCET